MAGSIPASATTDGGLWADARRRLAILTAALEPPPTFDVIDYDVPPPPPEELIYVDRPVLAFGDPGRGCCPTVENTSGRRQSQ